MKLNNEKSRSPGSLVKKVNTDEANDTCTLTVGTDAKVAGIALVAKTSVDTLV